MATTFEEDEDGNEYVSFDPADYEAGDFKVGDRIRISTEIEDLPYKGAEGVVVGIDSGVDHEVTKHGDIGDSGDVIYPVRVWLDCMGDRPAAVNGWVMGLPVSANEIVKVGK